MKRKLKALADLTRLGHGLMLMLAVLIGALIAFKGLPSNRIKILFALLTPLLLETSTFALNDYCDEDIDRRNNRTDRPIVRGDISSKEALLVFYLLFPLGLLSSFFVNWMCFLIALLTGLFAVGYDIKLKKIKPVGNVYIAYTMAIPFLFGGVIRSPQVPPIIWILAGMAFLSGTGREIMKDVMDIEGDKKEEVRSLPMYIGTRGSYTLSSILYLSAVTVSLLPYFYEITPSFHGDNLYLAIVLLADALFVSISLLLTVGKREATQLYRHLTLGAMVIGLISFLVGSLF